MYYGLPSPYSLYQEIAIDLLPRRDYISGGVWFFTAEARSVIEGIIDLWMPAAAIRGTATQFLTPTTETTLTIPSTAGNVITVGAYDSSTNTLAPFPAEDIPGIPDRSNRIWSLPVSTSPAVLSGAVTNPEAAPPWLLLL